VKQIAEKVGSCLASRYTLSLKDGKDLMKSGEFKGSARVILMFPILFFLLFCASKPNLIGKWKEVGKVATIEFSKDGTFKAVDNQGMAVSGKYTFFKGGHLWCEIQQKGGAGEVISLRISIKGDELTLTSSNSSEVENYRREK
jgi:hypothetical protein